MTAMNASIPTTGAESTLKVSEGEFEFLSCQSVHLGFNGEDLLRC